MCELFGFSGRRAADVTDYLKIFFSHSRMHPHGWGVMHSKGIVKEPVKAEDSETLKTLLNDLPPQKNMLAHIRYATVGSIKEENCHPFSGIDISGRRWTMIHNGTIYSGKNTYRYYKTQSGDTDSERLFLSFLDAMNDALCKGRLTERERFCAVSEFVETHAPRNKLNLMIFDGELLYVHKNLKNTLSYRYTDDGVMISTLPLDRGVWIPFPMAQVIAFKNGEEHYRGKRHSGVFIPNLEYITAYDAMNI